MSAHGTSTATTLIMISSPPGSLTVYLVWSVRSRLPRTKGLRSRPFPGPWAFAQAAPQAAQVRPSSALSDGGILRPSAGLLQCLHPLPVQGRPKRAVPSAARYYRVCPAQAPGAVRLSVTPNICFPLQPPASRPKWRRSLLSTIFHQSVVRRLPWR